MSDKISLKRESLIRDSLNNYRLDSGASDVYCRGGKPMNQIMVRFECGREDRIGEPFGPFPFVQQTYSWLRPGPDGEFDLAVHGVDGDWYIDHRFCRNEEDKLPWSDFVVYAAD